jgi:hypothetical protein
MAATMHRLPNITRSDKARLSAMWRTRSVDVLAVAGGDRLLLALGKPLLWLFGPNSWSATTSCSLPRSASGAPRSAIERLLRHARPSAHLRAGLCARFVMNVVLCVMLVPRFGGHGAAAATSISLAFETVLLFWIVRRRLDCTCWRSGSADPDGRSPAAAPAVAPSDRRSPFPRSANARRPHLWPQDGTTVDRGIVGNTKNSHAHMKYSYFLRSFAIDGTPGLH